MRKCIAAHTSLTPIYPGYVNASVEDDGTVVVTVRGDPTVREHGAFICGHAADKGRPGRCTHGDDRCNNYCNMAPQNGPMQATPAPCAQTFEGETVAVRMSQAEWATFVAALNQG